MDDTLERLRLRCEAADHLLKAVIAVLTERDPEFLKKVVELFMVADAHDSPIADMRAQVWDEISKELAAVRELVLDDEPAAPLTPRVLNRAH